MNAAPIEHRKPAGRPSLHEIAATRVMADTNTVIARVDASIAELVDIAAELARIRIDIARMHGLPEPDDDAPAAET